MSAPPAGLSAHDPAGARAAALRRVRLPALLLALVGALVLCGGIIAVVAPLARALEAALDPSQPHGVHGLATHGLFWRPTGLLLGPVMLAGGLAMGRLRLHGLAVAAAAVSLVPLCSGWCCLSMPVGLWALLTLLRPEVMAAFRA